MNPVSATLIVRDDRHILKTIACLRPYVAEICVGHTPCEELSANELNRVVDRYIEIPPIADGRIFDWAKARNAVHAIATQPFVLWADSDDTLRGLEHLPAVLERLQSKPLSRVLCPYEYLRDSKGRVTHRQWRERIVRNDGRFHWERPCHEVLVAKDGQYDHPEPRAPEIVWEHNREEQAAENGRQLAMLQAYEADGHANDPWLLLNLGLELGRQRRNAEAAKYLERYVEASKWDDERAWVMCQLARITLAARVETKGKGGWLDDDEARYWANQARMLRPDWFEPRFELARLDAMRAQLGDTEALRTAAKWCALAREAPGADHPLAVNVEEREYWVHDLERDVCESLQNWRGAAAAVGRIIEKRPDDGAARMAKMRYEAAIRLDEAAASEIEKDLPTRFVDASIRAHSGKLDILFACGRSWSEWNPAVLAEKGLGGSETAVVEMAKRLAAKGHRVRVYCTSGGPGLYDGVQYVESTSIANAPKCDVLVAWRNAQLLDFAEARARLLWVHDTEAANMGPRAAARADRVLALSEWHRRNLIEKHGLAEGQVVRTRNGVDLARFDRPIAGDPHRAIYSSSADRGLQVLLDLWPEIRRRVPDATLDVFYGMDLWREVAERSGSQQQRYTASSLERRLRSTAGVTYHGAVDQGTLARAMLGAGVWCGSLWFDETSCIGAMEAQAAGCRLVAGARAALLETIGERGTLIDGDWLSDRYQTRLVDAVVEAMRREGDADRIALAQYARDHFGWDAVADSWLELFAEVLAESDRGVMPEYPRKRAA